MVATLAHVVFCCAPGCLLAQTAPIRLQPDDYIFRKEVYAEKKGVRMPYRLFVPNGYDAGQKYPLILWFHGGSGRGSDNEAQITKGNELGTHIWTTKEHQERFPTFVVAPQCSGEENWGDPDLNEITPPLQRALDILAQVEKDYSIDASRIFLVGQSMGGLGVWTLLQTFPEKWAGAIVLSSFDNFTNPKGVARVPLWIFQGEADLTVPIELVRQMVKDLKKAGGQPRYTEYHKASHDIWDKAFHEPDLIDWITAQKRTN
jgi:predicted peptidase